MRGHLQLCRGDIGRPLVLGNYGPKLTVFYAIHSTRLGGKGTKMIDIHPNKRQAELLLHALNFLFDQDEVASEDYQFFATLANRLHHIRTRKAKRNLPKKQSV